MAELPPGQILGGKYTLQALLRRAPWASTYRAITSPNRELVVKVLDPALAGRPEILEAIRTAETAGAAVPAHLALRVVEQGVDAGAEVAFIVTAAAATPSLEQLVELCPLTPSEAVSFAVNLGRALDALHLAGYRHLALKPSNVFVGPAPECAVQLADFGANAIRALLDTDARLSFTARWLAPEQVDGDANAGPEADVFAAALVVFFAMTGRSLWRSCGGSAVDLAAWREEVLRVPPRVSERASELGAVVHPAFDDAFTMALASRQIRTKSVAVFAQSLADALPTVATAPAPVESNALATAVSLPPEAMEAEPAEAPTHTPTLAPPAGQSLPPAPVRAAPSAEGVGAVRAPPLPALSRPHTVPYFTEPGMDPAGASERSPAGDVPAPLLPVAVPAEAVDAQAAPLPVTPAPPGWRGRRRWAALAVGVAIGVSGVVFALGRARGVSSHGAAAAGAADEPGQPVPSAGHTGQSLASTPPPAELAPPVPAPVVATPEAARATSVASAGNADDAELTVVCEPACDLVMVDNRTVTDYPKTLHLRPGAHGVGASRAHYGGQWKQVTVKPGEEATLTFTLSPSAGAIQKKPCGHFLKHCKD